MNKLGFIDFSEISPIAIALGAVGALAGFWAARDVNMFWRILTTLACGAVGFVIAQKMAERG